MRAQKGEKEMDKATKEKVYALIQKMAPELLDRALEANDPVEAILQAWVDAREMRKQWPALEKGLIAEPKSGMVLITICEAGQPLKSILAEF